MEQDLQYLVGTSIAVVALRLAWPFSAADESFAALFVDGGKVLTMTHSVVAGPTASGSASSGFGG